MFGFDWVIVYVLSLSLFFSPGGGGGDQFYYHILGSFMINMVLFWLQEIGLLKLLRYSCDISIF